VRILVDTQCWIWMLAAPERFAPSTRQLLQDPSTELLVSAASIWEVAIKSGLGKLTLPGAPQAVVPEMMERSRVTSLPVLASHAVRVASLPHHHRDPFDRMLVAQAQLEGLPILTADRALAAYEVEVLDP